MAVSKPTINSYPLTTTGAAAIATHNDVFTISFPPLKPQFELYSCGSESPPANLTTYITSLCRDFHLKTTHDYRDSRRRCCRTRRRFHLPFDHFSASGCQTLLIVTTSTSTLMPSVDCDQCQPLPMRVLTSATLCMHPPACQPVCLPVFGFASSNSNQPNQPSPPVFLTHTKLTWLTQFGLVS